MGVISKKKKRKKLGQNQNNVVTSADSIFFCPKCLRCWDRYGIYAKGNLPSIGKEKQICNECLLQNK